jgi:hypothetical protein
MKEQDISSLRFLKENIEEIVAPLDAAQIEYFGEGSERIQHSLDLVMEELSMVILLLMGVDAGITNEELDLLNDMRHIVLGYDIPELNSENYMELLRKFHAAYPERIFTVDHMPTTVRILLAYDKKHGSSHATNARELFAKFADAIIVTDKDKDFMEWALVENFKEFMRNG